MFHPTAPRRRSQHTNRRIRRRRYCTWSAFQAEGAKNVSCCDQKFSKACQASFTTLLRGYMVMQPQSLQRFENKFTVHDSLPFAWIWYAYESPLWCLLRFFLRLATCPFVRDNATILTKSLVVYFHGSCLHFFWIYRYLFSWQIEVDRRGKPFKAFAPPEIKMEAQSTYAEDFDKKVSCCVTLKELFPHVTMNALQPIIPVGPAVQKKNSWFKMEHLGDSMADHTEYKAEFLHIPEEHMKGAKMDSFKPVHRPVANKDVDTGITNHRVRFPNK